jgi:hypothetical protein
MQMSAVSTFGRSTDQEAKLSVKYFLTNSVVRRRLDDVYEYVESSDPGCVRVFLLVNIVAVFNELRGCTVHQ